MHHLEKALVLGYTLGCQFVIHPSLDTLLGVHVRGNLLCRQYKHDTGLGISHPISKLPHPRFFRRILALFHYHNFGAVVGFVHWCIPSRLVWGTPLSMV
jgi:hypothetical protein